MLLILTFLFSFYSFFLLHFKINNLLKLLEMLLKTRWEWCMIADIYSRYISFLFVFKEEEKNQLKTGRFILMVAVTNQQGIFSETFFPVLDRCILSLSISDTHCQEEGGKLFMSYSRQHQSWFKFLRKYLLIFIVQSTVSKSHWSLFEFTLPGYRHQWLFLPRI